LKLGCRITSAHTYRIHYSSKIFSTISCMSNQTQYAIHFYVYLRYGKNYIFMHRFEKKSKKYADKHMNVFYFAQCKYSGSTGKMSINERMIVSHFHFSRVDKIILRTIERAIKLYENINWSTKELLDNFFYIYGASCLNI